MTNRSDLVEALNQDGYPHPAAVVKRVIDVIGLALACGETVSIRNFGSFEPRTRIAVTRRNPKTGEPVEVPEKYTVGFRPAPALRDRLKGGLT